MGPDTSFLKESMHLAKQEGTQVSCFDSRAALNATWKLHVAVLCSLLTPHERKSPVQQKGMKVRTRPSRKRENARGTDSGHIDRRYLCDDYAWVCGGHITAPRLNA